MEAAPPIETIVHAVQTLYHNPDASEKERASNWLGQFQRSVHAWQLSDQLLRMKQDVETCYFAAQTMRTKIQYSFHELPTDSHQSLRDSLINHVESLSDPNFQVILTQLCLALADLALQMVQWKNSASDLIQRFSGNEAHIPVLMELLTVLPEEIHSRALRLGLNRREDFTQELRLTAPTVIELMTMCSERYINDERLLGKVFKCLASWFYLGVVPTNDASSIKLLNLLLQILRKTNTQSMLHEAASDCICSALYAMEDIDDHLVLAEALYRGIMELPEAYALTVAEEDVDKAINYCRIFTELGEAFMEVMVDSPGQGLGDLKILDAVLNCVGHCQYEVAEITFNFWYRLSEILYKRDNKDLNNIYRPYIERLIHSLSVHCQMDSDHEGIPDESDDFGDFRVRVAELIKDVIFLVGSSTCFAQIFTNLASQQAATWDITEAALFVMTAVAKNVLPEEGQIVPQVIQAIINLPEGTHIAVKHTSIHMLGELSEWIEKHPEVLEPVLNFLTSGLSHKDLASVAATSIQNICSQCQDHMKDHCEGLLQIAQALDAFNLSEEATIGIIKGAAVVLARLPIDKVEAGLKQLVLVQVNPLSQILKNDVRMLNKVDPTMWLDRLAAIFRNTNPQVTNGQIHPCLTILQEIWPVLSDTFVQYQGDVRVIERCCRCIRFAIRCIGKGSAVLLTPLVTQMVTIYQTHQHSCFLYLGSILVDEYGGELDCIPSLVEMLQAFIPPTFQMFQQEHGVRNHPDTVEDFFRLCYRLLQRCPVAFLQSTATIDPIIQCGIAASKLDHRDANASVSKFFHELIQSSRVRWESEDFQTRKTLVENAIKTHGAALVQGIIDACVFYLPSYMMPDHAEVLFDLMQVDRQSVCTWLEAALKSLPAQLSDGRVNATQKQLTDFHKAVTSAEDLKTVTYAVRDFCRLFW